MSSGTVVPSAAQAESFTLTPGQQRTFELAERIIRVAPVVLIEGGIGLGKTLLLQRLQAALGGANYRRDRCAAGGRRPWHRHD